MCQSKLPLLSELRALVDSMDGGSDGASTADVAQDEWRRAADKLDFAASQMYDMSQLWHVQPSTELVVGRRMGLFEDNLENWRCMLKPLSRKLSDAGTDTFLTYPMWPDAPLQRRST